MSDAKLFLIDAHALCYRSFFAIKGLSTHRGQATNAVFGFVNTLRKILRDFQPGYMAACFDSKAKTHRQEKFAEYKIQRPTMPDALISQIPIIKEVVDAYQVPVFECAGFEADDIIATIVNKIKSSDIEVVIVSDDKDMFQLVNERVRIFSVRKNKFLDSQDVKETLGIEPKYVPDYISLAGDPTDNIPGITGIGVVSAKNLIKQYGSMENIMEHITDVKTQRIRECLSGQKDRAFLSKELAILDVNVPIQCELKDLKVKSPDNKRLFEMFNDLEFNRLAAELSPGVEKEQAPAFQKISTPSEAKALVAQIIKKGQFCFLLDSTGETDLAFQQTGMVISLDAEKLYCVSLDEMQSFKTVFEDNKIFKITHDIKENLKVLHRHHCGIKGKIFDCLLAGYLLSPVRTSHDIKTLAWQYLKIALGEADKLLRETKVLLPLYSELQQELESRDLVALFYDIEVPLATVLFCMEEEGVKLDEKLLAKLSKECAQKIEGLMKEIFELAGEQFNLNSPKQLCIILFEKLKLPVIKKTKTGYSTNESVLRQLAPQHPLPALILEYRQLAKLKSTYIDALPKLVHLSTGRIHAVFNQTGTETGRLSSNNPNLQNIPIRTDLGRQIRKAFISSGKGRLIMAADYSQIELRILAHLSGDKNLIKAFAEDQDIHKFTASLIFDVSENEVTRQMRYSAKRVNFGIIYGMSAFGLAKDLDIPQDQAREFIDKYFLRYPDVKTFMDNEIVKCEEKGYVLTLLHRRRDIPEINSRNMAIRQFAQRQAINTPVQGSAADLMKLAMINVHQAMEKQKLISKMIISVHDELVFDVPEAEQEIMTDLIRKHMEQPLSLSVPIKVTVKRGKNWLEMEE